MLKEGVGIRGTARILHISVTTVISRIKFIAQQVKQRNTFESGGTYEIDELWTYVGKKDHHQWITYAVNRQTKGVINFTIGSRTKEQLSNVTNSVLALLPGKICTDGLLTYRSLLPNKIHWVGLPHTRRIERFNLNLRTHLKRLTRKTICFSRSCEMLDACLRIYFWG